MGKTGAMSVATASEAISSLKESSRIRGTECRLGALGVIAVSIWCGLAAGLLEVAMNVLATRVGRDGILHHTRHFVWIIPLIDLFLFCALGLGLALMVKLWTRSAGWLSVGLLVTLSLFPALLVLFPRIYSLASFFVALGIGTQLVAVVQRDPARFRRVFRLSFVLLGLAVALLPACLFGGEAIASWRASARPLPAPGSPNVLLIVLDTVGADHSNLYGYPRRTTPNLERLAREGIRFDAARASAPWTFPSHASMFTGRWPHELNVGWFTPLDGRYPTLAEYLGSRGYATAGFVGNMGYCSRGTGLERGFTWYEDHILTAKTSLKMAKLTNLVFRGADWLTMAVRDYIKLDLHAPLQRFVFAAGRPSAAKTTVSAVVSTSASDTDHFLDGTLGDHRKPKNASQVNQQFLDWLSRSSHSQRPFFAFLNYIDAHESYVVPEAFEWRTGEKPRTKEDYELILYWHFRDKGGLSQHEIDLGRAAYDKCIAYIDDRFGRLIDELESRGVLDESLVIITGDHGEEFGENGFFEHGLDLYHGQIHVPLVILLPKRSRTRCVVGELVSLRDLPATIVDLLGIASSSPFPGRSLARFWNGDSRGAASDGSEEVLSEIHAPPPDNAELTRIPGAPWPVVSLASGDYLYIRNEGNHREELYNLRQDPQERRNLVDGDNEKDVLGRLRDRLSSSVGDVARLRTPP
jgi:arylsulfatase A-like enzyme